MKSSPRVPTRVRDLVDAACDDTITAEQSRELENILRGDEESRQYYLLYFHTLSHVRINVVADRAFQEVCRQIERQQRLEQSLATTEEVATEEVEDVAAESEAARPRSKGGWPKPHRRFAWKAFSRETRFAFSVATLVVVAVLGVLAMLRVSAYRQMAIEATQTPAFVAHLSRQLDAKWQDPDSAPSVGQLLAVNEQLQLAEGLVEIVLDRGTKVTVEGPATFTLTSDNGGKLQLGRLVARVPEKSIGFKLETPLLTLVDLGTEFGVEVDGSQKMAEVYVFDGVVEASVNNEDSQPGPDGAIVLQGGEALRCEPGRLIADAAAVDPKRFVRTLPWKAKPVPHSEEQHGKWQASYAEFVQQPDVAGYWSFDDETLADGSQNHNDGTPVGQVSFSSDVPGWVGGGRALRLQGSDGYVKIPHSPTLVCTHAVTVAFWMKGIAAEQTDGFTRPVAKRKEGGVGWELQTNSDTPGLSVRIDTNLQTNATRSIGDALDGRWHHVAVVIRGGQVATFFDGVTLFEHEGYEHGAGFEQNEAGLQFGVQNDGTRGYHGLIDEVILFRGALSRKEILRLASGAAIVKPAADATNTDATNEENENHAQP